MACMSSKPAAASEIAGAESGNQRNWLAYHIYNNDQLSELSAPSAPVLGLFQKG
jgi:hypothetical protein